MTTNAKAADTARCGNNTATIIPMITNTITKTTAIIIIYILLPKKCNLKNKTKSRISLGTLRIQIDIFLTILLYIASL